MMHFIFVVKELDDGKVPVEMLQKRDLCSFDEVFRTSIHEFKSVVLFCCFCYVFIRIF